MVLTPQRKLEGEIQFALVEAWEAVNRVVVLAEGGPFGRTALRLEWMTVLRALRGCCLLSAGRLLDIGVLETIPIYKSGYTLEEGKVALKRVRRKRGVTGLTDRQVKLLKVFCPFNFPPQSYGLGRAAAWVEAGELALGPFIGGEVFKRGEVERRANVLVKQMLQQRKVSALAACNEALDRAAERLQTRQAAERAELDELRKAREARIVSDATLMRRRAGLE